MTGQKGLSVPEQLKESIMFFIVKVFISAFLIAFASWLAGKNPILAGFIVALPIVSMLAIFFAYHEYHDIDKLHQFALSIVVAIPLSLSFFIPFLLHKWIKFSFAGSFVLGIVLLVFAYFIHVALLKSG
jgi:hypothetical protein